MESIQQPISQRKRNWIIAAALAIGCTWGMLVFYSIVDRNQDDLTVAPKGSYAPQTPAPAAIGSSSFYQAPRYNAPMRRRVITHQPSAFGYTPAPNAAMGSTSSGTAMRVHQTSSATLQSYGGSGSGGGSTASFSKRNSAGNGGGVSYTALAYTGAIYIPTPHNAVTAVGASEVENVAARKMGAPKRIKMGGGEGEWPDEPEDPAPDPEPPVPVGDIPMALMAILAAAYALCVVLRRKADA